MPSVSDDVNPWWEIDSIEVGDYAFSRFGLGKVQTVTRSDGKLLSILVSTLTTTKGDTYHGPQTLSRKDVIARVPQGKPVQQAGEHYKQFEIEPVDVAEVYMSHEELRGGYWFAALKYVMRWRKKGGLVDLGKGIDYMCRLYMHEAGVDVKE